MAANARNQNFRCDRPDQKWDAIIRYIWTSGGWLFLAIGVDLYSRRSIGCEVRDRMNKAIAISTLHKAIAIRQPKPGVIHHTQIGEASMPVIRIEKSAKHTTSFPPWATKETATIMQWWKQYVQRSRQDCSGSALHSRT